MARRSSCGSVLALYAVIIGCAFFSILWDFTAEAWGLDHTTVLVIFLGAAFAVSVIAAWMKESAAWYDIRAGWSAKRRARRARKR